MPLLLPAAPAGDHDSEPGSHGLDHKGHELLSGECNTTSWQMKLCDLFR